MIQMTENIMMFYNLFIDKCNEQMIDVYLYLGCVFNIPTYRSMSQLLHWYVGTLVQ